MSDLFTIKTDFNSIFQIVESRVWGGQEIKLSPGHTLQEIIDFVQKFKEKEEADARVRNNNAFVKGLYDQYKTALELARTEVI
jgi:hypothetical protein